MAAIAANLDDLQSGMEASSRTTNALQSDTMKLDGHLRGGLLRSVLRHVKHLQACAREQRAAMQELREGITRLQQELKRSIGAVRPPLVMADPRVSDYTAQRS
jgi:hypothetical protein